MEVLTEPADSAPIDERALYRRITRRLIPYMFLLYIAAYVDRVNIGFAKLQMQRDLGMSETVYGIGAGIFFIGYFLFEVPSNVVLQAWAQGYADSGVAHAQQLLAYLQTGAVPGGQAGLARIARACDWARALLMQERRG